MTDAFDDLDARTLSAIGDPITYLTGGVAPGLALKAWVNHAPPVVNFGSSSAVSAQATAQIRKVDVPAPDRANDRIILPRTGLTFRITAYPQSRCGRYWDMELVKA